MKKNYIIIGDSLPYGVGDYLNNGWVALLKKEIMVLDQNSKNVSNYVHSAAFPGATSKVIAYRIDSILDTYVFDADNVENEVVLSIGVNDTKTINGEQQINLSNFIVNITSIIQKVRSRHCNITILGLTRTIPTTYVEFKEGQFFVNDVIDRYDEILKEICGLYNVDYIELSHILEQNHYHDGIHPNSEGHKLIYQKVITTVIDKKSTK